ncbi:MAG: hypothetical protein ACO3XN_00220 [Chthoniobacterales bacterium]
MKVVVSTFLCAVLAAVSAARAQDPAKMLKVPAVSDRPVDGPSAPAAPEKSAETPDAAPAPAPSSTPEPSTPPGETGAGDESSEERDDDVVPESFPLSRYEPLWEKSPFQLESIAPPQQSEGLAQRFVLGGILRESGEPVVWVRERGSQESHKVARNATNKLGLSLVEVDESMSRQSDATATIRLGAEVGVIKFDAAPASVPAVMAAPGRPGQLPVPIAAPGRTAGAVPLPGVAAPQQPGANTALSQPGIVPPVPGPGVPQTGQVQAPGQPAMPPPRVIRRRAIIPAAP